MVGNDGGIRSRAQESWVQQQPFTYAAYCQRGRHSLRKIRRRTLWPPVRDL